MSRGKVLTRLVELRSEITTFLEEKTELAACLLDDQFIMKLTYLSDIFLKLNELNLYLQGSGVDIFSVHDKIRGFIKKIDLWKKKIQNHNYDCFETLLTFLIEKNMKLEDNVAVDITAHLNSLRENFETYFLEEMENYSQKIWIVDPFQSNITSNLSTKAHEELIDLSEDFSLRRNFNRSKIIDKFWLSVEEKYPTISTDALKTLLPFLSSYLCEKGIKTKYRNQLQLSNSLRLKLFNEDVDIDAIINKNRKQTHSSHTPKY